MCVFFLLCMFIKRCEFIFFQQFWHGDNFLYLFHYNFYFVNDAQRKFVHFFAFFSLVEHHQITQKFMSIFIGSMVITGLSLSVYDWGNNRSPWLILIRPIVFAEFQNIASGIMTRPNWMWLENNPSHYALWFGFKILF